MITGYFVAFRVPYAVSVGGVPPMLEERASWWAGPLLPEGKEAEKAPGNISRKPAPRDSRPHSLSLDRREQGDPVLLT